ncbi:MAG: YIP1 family protein [Pseudomonadota bacterium]
MLKLFVDLFTAPGAAFATLKAKPGFLLPLLLLVAAAVGLNAAYFALVDPEFLVEDILQRAGDDITAEEERGIREFANAEGRGGRWLPTIGGGFFFIVILLVHATYYSLVSMARGHQIRFRQWFAFVSWSYLPSLLALLAGAIALAIAPGFELSLNDLNPLSIANLLNVDGLSGNARVLQQIDVTQLWTLCLLALGYRAWTGARWAVSLLVALVPFIVAYSLPLLFA